MAVTRISIKEVMDFCWCPEYYALKHNNPNESNLKEIYDTTLHKCFYAYLRALQNNTLNSGVEFIKHRWGQEWIKQKKNSEVICTPSAAKRDTYDSKRRAGIDAIITFDKLMDVPQCPVLINKEYAIKITKDIALTGIWEYIREIKIDEENRFQILKFRTENNRFQVDSQMRHDLELTAAALAFKKMFNAEDFDLVYVDIYKKKMFSSTRDEKDFLLLAQTVKSVVHCIQNNIKCVSPDKKCFHCEYRDICTSKLAAPLKKRTRRKEKENDNEV